MTAIGMIGAGSWGIKFGPPETLEHFGGAKKYADAVNSCLTKVGQLLRKPDQLRRVLLGEGA